MIPIKGREPRSAPIDGPTTSPLLTRSPISFAGNEDAVGRRPKDALPAVAAPLRWYARVGKRAPLGEHAPERRTSLRLDHRMGVPPATKPGPKATTSGASADARAQVALGHDGVHQQIGLQPAPYPRLRVHEHRHGAASRRPGISSALGQHPFEALHVHPSLDRPRRPAPPFGARPWAAPSRS